MFLIIFILSFVNAVNAQYENKWYYRHCDVIDINNCTPEEFECMWNKATKNVRTGAILTGVGTPLTISGAIFIFLYSNGIYNGSDGLTWVLIVGGIVGVVFNLVGIPILATGINQKSKLKKTTYYDILMSGSLNIQPTIRLNKIHDSPYLGLSISLNF